MEELDLSKINHMQVKCSSCGAYLTLSDKCEFCGVTLQNNKEISNEDLKSFKLACFEFDNKKYSKSSLLFDELIKNDSELFAAWVYKVVSDFLYNFNYEIDFDALLKNIKFLIENSKNESSKRFLEKKLIFLIDQIFIDEYTYGNRYINLEEYLRLKKSNTNKFFEFLNNLSQLFSIEFSHELIKTLVKYFENHESFIKIPFYRDVINSDGVNLMKDLLSKNPESSNQLFKAIIEAIIFKLEYRLEQELNDTQFKRYNIQVGIEKITIDSYLQDSRELANSFFKITNIDNNKILNDFELKLKSFPIIIENYETEKTKSEGCFIATATMGDYDDPVLIDLRFFRDNWLIKRSWGIKFIDWYYIYGSKTARVIEKSMLLRMLSYIFLVKPLHLIIKKFKN